MPKIPKKAAAKAKRTGVLELDDYGLEALPLLTGLSGSLRELRLPNNDFQEADLSALEGLTGLEVLDLSRCELRHWPPAPGSVRELLLSYNELMGMGCMDNCDARLAGWPLVEVLEIECCGFEHTPPIVANMPALRRLSVMYNKIEELDGLDGLGALEELFIGGTDLWELPALPAQLRVLSLEENESASNDFDLSPLLEMEQLEELTISECDFTELPPLPPNLRRLLCDRARLGEADLGALALAASLEHLDLNNCDLRAVPPLPPNLRSLVLTGNGALSDASDVSGLAAAPQLESLKISCAPDVLAAVLPQLPQLAEAEGFDLDQLRAGGAAAAAGRPAKRARVAGAGAGAGAAAGASAATGSVLGGRFQVLRAPGRMKIADVCAHHGVAPAGTVFYELQKKESISAKKAVVVQTAAGDWVAGDGARAAAGLGAGAIKVAPADLPAGVAAFVQSSSHNRLVPEGARVVVEV